tara:strand:+ start:15195 stop:16169 length:975 start_codon:yes stop_codon:yes gene_type:complete
MICSSVVIGRNEGPRLGRCLNSLFDCQKIIYVDSGSTDNSVSIAKSLGVDVVELDMDIPFTAARARNAGYRYLLKKFSDTELIQFVDADCEVVDGWVKSGADFLSENSEYAVVCGRRRERFVDMSLFNLLCDLEWDTPVGEARACGGDALIRVSALTAVDGYKDSLIAGEEPEMCFRMRQLGWKIMRLDAEMTLHDAAMTRFSQWWKRNQRAGHAYAEGYALHGKSLEKFKRSECRSILFWSCVLPIVIILLTMITPLFLVLFLVYPLQVMRLTLRHRRRWGNVNLAFIYAFSIVVGKWPQLFGMMAFLKNKKLGLTSQIIEYK